MKSRKHFSCFFFSPARVHTFSFTIISLHVIRLWWLSFYFWHNLYDLHIKGAKVPTLLCFHALLRKASRDNPHNSKANDIAFLLCELSLRALRNNACKHNNVSTFAHCCVEKHVLPLALLLCGAFYFLIKAPIKVLLKICGKYFHCLIISSDLYKLLLISWSPFLHNNFINTLTVQWEVDVGI